MPDTKDSRVPNTVYHHHDDTVDAVTCYVAGRLHYLLRWVCLVDMLVLAATGLLLLFSAERGKQFSPKVVHNLRFIQILRLLHIDRQMATWKMIKDMVKMSKYELMAAYYMTMLLCLLLAASVYLTESIGGSSINCAK